MAGLIRFIEVFAGVARWKNLVFIAGIQVILFYKCYFVLAPDTAIINLYNLPLLIIISICLAASGYIVNDIYDQASDFINRPNKRIIGSYISVSNAWWAYGILVAMSLIIILFSGLSNSLEFLVVAIVLHVLLWAYSAFLQRTLLIGNMLVALLCAGVVWVFNYVDFQYLSNQYLYGMSFSRGIWIYGAFAGGLNLIREIVKDAEDAEGDRLHPYHSIFNDYGAIVTKRLTSFLTILFITGLIIFFVGTWIPVNKISQLLLLMCILLLVGVLLRIGAENWKSAARLLKISMLVGLMIIIWI